MGDIYERYDSVEDWVASRPPAVRAVATKFPPHTCYRSISVGNRGHYILYSYDEPEDDGPVTVQVVHGADSFLPGCQVFGIDPKTLVKCGCGQWTSAALNPSASADREGGGDG